MIPPTLSDFNFKIDDYCFYAEEESKVLGIARQLDIYEPLMKYSSEAAILSFFYTHQKNALDLAFFLVIPEGGPRGKYMCFYFRNFLHQAYDIGKRLQEFIPPDLIDHQEYRAELQPALNYLLKEFAPGSQAGLFRSRDSWGFYFSRYKGRDLPSLN